VCSPIPVTANQYIDKINAEFCWTKTLTIDDAYRSQDSSTVAQYMSVHIIMHYAEPSRRYYAAPFISASASSARCGPLLQTS